MSDYIQYAFDFFQNGLNDLMDDVRPVSQLIGKLFSYIPREFQYLLILMLLVVFVAKVVSVLKRG